MRPIDEPLCEIIDDAGDADVQASAQDVSDRLIERQGHLGIDRGLRRKPDALFPRRIGERALESGGPAGREELLRVGAGAV